MKILPPLLHIHIVCHDGVIGWILEKFAVNLARELSLLGVRSTVGPGADPVADINHHIGGYSGEQKHVDTFMVTHVDSLKKLHRIRRLTRAAGLAICMSRETMERLHAADVPRRRLCFVNPAHDGVIQPRPLRVGMASSSAADAAGQAALLVDVAAQLAPGDFCFQMVGPGWKEVSSSLRSRGFAVDDSQREFSGESYAKIVPFFDLYLSTSEGENTPGFLEAVAAGVPSLVTAEGYRLDAAGAISCAIRADPAHIVAALNRAQLDRQRRRAAVASWTWAAYAQKHLDIWARLRGQPFASTHGGPDGVASMAEAAPLRRRDRVAAFAYFHTRPLTWVDYGWTVSAIAGRALPRPVRRSLKSLVKRWFLGR